MASSESLDTLGHSDNPGIQNSVAQKCDVVVIGDCDAFDASEFKHTRDPGLLYIEDSQASIPFLKEYFLNGFDETNAKAVHSKKWVISLGAVFIKQFIASRLGLKTKLIYEYSMKFMKEFEKSVKDAKVMILCTTFMFLWSSVERIARHAKSINPNIIIIAGGMTVYKAAKCRMDIDNKMLSQEDALVYSKRCPLFLAPIHETSVDYLIISLSGEETLFSLMKKLSNGDDVEKDSLLDIPNVAIYDPAMKNFRWKSIVHESPSNVSVDWSLEKMPENTWYPVQVGQGCPFRCAFCDFAQVSPKITYVEPDIVFETMKTIPLNKHGVRKVLFTNENLLTNKKVGMKFLQEMVDSKLNVKYTTFLRADAVQDEATADLLAKSGCVRAMIGVESVDATILKNMRKSCTPAQVERCLTLLMSRNIMAAASIITGFPGETQQTFENTMNALNRTAKDQPGVLVVAPFALLVAPMSPVSMPDMRKEFNLQGWGKFWKTDTLTYEKAAELAHSVSSKLEPYVTIRYNNEDDVDDFFEYSNDERRSIYFFRSYLASEYKINPNMPYPKSKKELKYAGDMKDEVRGAWRMLYKIILHK